MKHRAPKNTERETQENPGRFLIDVLASAEPSDPILRQEAEGQTSFVESTTLPTDWNFHPEDREVLEHAGVEFGEVVEGDPLFRYVTLPPGWRKVPTDHPMWSDLLDEKGRRRAMIFYKAAFYDRSAHIDLTRRYEYRSDYERLDVGIAHVYDGSQIIYETEPVALESEEEVRRRLPHLREEAGWQRHASYLARREAEEASRAWLNEHFPKWNDCGAYWD